MKIKNYAKELLVLLGLIVLSITVLNPGGFVMIEMVHMSLLVAISAIVMYYIAAVWRQKGRDEREETHYAKAGRNSFLIGVAILTIGIVFQSLNHDLDPILIVTLAGMLTAKIVSIVMYSERN